MSSQQPGRRMQGESAPGLPSPLARLAWPVVFAGAQQPPALAKLPPQHMQWEPMPGATLPVPATRCTVAPPACAYRAPAACVAALSVPSVLNSVPLPPEAPPPKHSSSSSDESLCDVQMEDESAGTKLLAPPFNLLREESVDEVVLVDTPPAADVGGIAAALAQLQAACLFQQLPRGSAQQLARGSAQQLAGLVSGAAGLVPHTFSAQAQAPLARAAFAARAPVAPAVPAPAPPAVRPRPPPSPATSIGAGSSKGQGWEADIVGRVFFGPCPKHRHLQKSDCHFYCVGCCPSGGAIMCDHCLPEHNARCAGTCFQVYRYMYNDVLRIADVAGLTDQLEGVQFYRANQHPAVHLRPRELPTNRTSQAAFTRSCGHCGRSLKEWSYCSLECKLLCGSKPSRQMLQAAPRAGGPAGEEGMEMGALTAAQRAPAGAAARPGPMLAQRSTGSLPSMLLTPDAEACGPVPPRTDSLLALAPLAPAPGAGAGAGTRRKRCLPLRSPAV